MAINLIARFGRETARRSLESSFAQFQADRAVVGLTRQIRKNETLLQIKEELARVKADMGERLPDRYHSRLLRLIDSHLGSEQDWLIFETNFNQVHEVFLHKLKASYPDLTPGDLRLAAYLKMNLSSKEIAPLLNISLRGVENKRYRLRQKLHLDNDANLTEFLMQY
jgi:DNA-binding CsgD family transcriptional regulator